MTYSIALAGKGGTGKTTLAGLLIKYLVQRHMTPVLAVDADPNSNLNEVLGLEVRETLGDAREEMKRGVSTGITKDVFMEMKLEQAVVEADKFDLIVMGRPEGPGCYCAANSLLTQYLERLIGNYAYVVIDNEAGMEHISRLTTNNIDLLVIVSDPSKRGIQAAARIKELTTELGLDVRAHSFIINQAREADLALVEKTSDFYELELTGIVPEDPILRELDVEGKPLIQISQESPALEAAFAIFDGLLKGKGP
ncbi:MAG: AAA family ATPase [Deltaproteobacteria bacterium]|nr:AAA family ATPase [Deltaproteobacteria bacterium]